MQHLSKLTLALAALAAASGLDPRPAAAQTALPSTSMPPPPSARDRIGPDGAAIDRSKAERKPARKSTGNAASTDGTAAPARRSATPSASPGYSEKIDTRAARQEMQLEDDPRAVQPVMQNGRPGVGMRF